MTFVTVLPELICLEVLSLWCEVEDLAKLDCAFCNVSGRESFTRLTQWKLFSLYPVKFLREEIILWLQLKGLKVSILKVDGGPRRYRVDEWEFNSIGDLFKTMHQPKPKIDIDYSSFINSCDSLNSLELFDVEAISDKVVLSLNPSILGQISTFSICHKTRITGEGIRFMASHCHKLKVLYLNMDFARAEISEEDVASLIRANPHITSIDLFKQHSSLTNLLFDVIAESCPLLTKLTVASARFATISSFTNFLSRCKKLEHVSITQEEYQFFKYNAPGGEKSSNKRLYCHCVPIGEDRRDVPVSDWFINKIVGFHAVTFIYPLGFDALDDTTMGTVATNNPQLKEFRASDCRTFTMTGVRQLLRRCDKLTTLQFRDCYVFPTFDEIKDAFSTPNVLDTLIFENFPVWTEAVIEIIRLCGSLKNIVLCDCHDVDTDIVRLYILVHERDINVSYSPSLLLD